MNLLPETEKNYIKKGIKSRFVVVGLSLLSVSFLIGTIMLLPSYFLVRTHYFDIRNNSLKSNTSMDEILNLPNEIDSKLNVFESNNTNIPTLEVVEEVVKESEDGVTLHSISILRNERSGDKSGIKILVSGLASTREALLSFSNSLKASNKFYLVEVPVSSFTKDKNLPFSINLFIEN